MIETASLLAMAIETGERDVLTRLHGLRNVEPESDAILDAMASPCSGRVTLKR